MVTLVLCCYARAFSGCSKWEVLSRGHMQVSHCSGFTYWGAWALGSRLQQLWLMGLVALQHVESSWTRDQTHVLCIGRWVLNHWTMREVQRYFSYKLATNQISRDEIQRWRKILDFCKSISVSNMSTTYKKKESQWQFLLHAVFISPPDFCRAAIQSSLLIWKTSPVSILYLS